MHFRILGPLEVRVDDVLVNFSGVRQRAVMAGLLAEANRVMSIDRLIKLLWDTQPPATAKEQVQNVVSAVRRTLDQWSPLAGTLATRSPGYMVSVAADQLDAVRFDELATQARSLAPTDPRAALTMYHEALGLWRGTALEGLRNEVIQAAANRLNEERLIVFEERVELELMMGGDRNLIGDLQFMTIENPLRERLRGLLMLALHRAGRTADALKVYRNTRRMLIDELGLEPSEQLRRLEQQILSNDRQLLRPVDPLPTKVVPSARAAEPAGKRPSTHIPSSFIKIAGRRAETKLAVEHLAAPAEATWQSPAIVVITGPPGVGKTAFAGSIARSMTAFPDGRLYTCMYDNNARPADLEATLRRFLAALGKPVPTEGLSTSALIEMYNDALANQSVLIVLDDVPDEAHVRGLLPTNGNCSVLITSRRPLTALALAHTIALPALDEEASIDMLSALLGPARVSAEPQAARRIAKLCDGLPLALHAIGARIAAKPHWRLSMAESRLANPKSRLAELCHSDLDLRSRLRRAENEQSAAATVLFRRLALLEDVPVPSWVAAALVSVDSPTAEVLLEQLVDSWLLTAEVDQTGQVLYRLPSLARCYAIERLLTDESVESKRSTIQRVRDVLTGTPWGRISVPEAGMRDPSQITNLELLETTC
jgi:DNA-binding SARP family transcriptional activator